MQSLIKHVHRQIHHKLPSVSYSEEDVLAIYELWAQSQNHFSFLEALSRVIVESHALVIFDEIKNSEEFFNLINEYHQQNYNENLEPFAIECLHFLEYRMIDKMITKFQNTTWHTEDIRKVLEIFRHVETLVINHYSQGLAFDLTLTPYDQWKDHNESNKISCLHSKLAQLIGETENEFDKTCYLCFSQQEHCQMSHLLLPLSTEYIDRIIPDITTSNLLETLDLQNEAVSAILDQVYCQLWSVFIDQHQSSLTSEDKIWIWSECVEEMLQHQVISHIKLVVINRLSHLVKQSYINLIDQRRPHEKKIASLCFWGENERNITVTFITRDGNLLAQRDYLWENEEIGGLSQALAEVNVKTLILSQILSVKVIRELDHLAQTYQIHHVSPIGLDPVPRPLNLTDAAQKAIRLGQRYVAPLRYWARIQLDDFVNYLLPETAYQMLTQYDQLNTVKTMIERENHLRWIKLRNHRAKRNKNKKQRH